MNGHAPSFLKTPGKAPFFSQFYIIFYLTYSSTIDSRYLEFQGTLRNTSRYPYLDISDLQNWGKNNSHNHI